MIKWFRGLSFGFYEGILLYIVHVHKQHTSMRSIAMRDRCGRSRDFDAAIRVFEMFSFQSTRVVSPTLLRPSPLRRTCWWTTTTFVNIIIISLLFCIRWIGGTENIQSVDCEPCRSSLIIHTQHTIQRQRLTFRIPGSKSNSSYSYVDCIILWSTAQTVMYCTQCFKSNEIY
jgi:hypothetical protein